MNINLTRAENNQDAILSVLLNYEDIREAAEKNLHTAKQKMNLPGFRKGKIPLTIAKNYLWEGIIKEELEKKLEESINDYFKTNNIDILKPVIPIESDVVMDLKNFTGHEFQYEVGIINKIDIDHVSLLSEIKQYDIKIEEADIDEQIEMIRETYGEHKHPDIVEDESHTSLYLEVTELNQNLEIIEGGVAKKISKKIDEIPESFKQLITGKKKNDSIEINIDELFPSRQAVAEFLTIDKLAADDLNQNFRVNIISINQNIKAELNEELFSKFTDGKAKTYDEFRNDARELLENAYNQESIKFLDDKIFHTLLGKIDIILPEKYIDHLFEKEFAEKNENYAAENLEKDKLNYKESIKWSTITDYLFKKFNIEITEKDIVEETYYYISNIYMQYGMRDINPDQMSQQIKDYLKNPENAQFIRRRVINGKVIVRIKTDLNFEKTEITLDNFKKLDLHKN